MAGGFEVGAEGPRLTAAGGRPAPEDKTEALVTRAVYLIATGKWPPGERLPSVRQAGAMWAVDRRTVLRAYRRLEEMGLVRALDRSGFFVVPGARLGRVSRHRHELARLYDSFCAEILRHMDLSVLGTFRYLAHLAESRAAERPECAFVECTRTQADGHAAEVESTLGVPCLALTVDELDGRFARVPAGVTTILVSTFHVSEIAPLAKEGNFNVAPVPIELSPDSLQGLEGIEEALLLEFDATEAENIAADVRKLRPELAVRGIAVHDAQGEIERLTAGSRAPRREFILSPRVWGSVAAECRRRPGVREARFRVHPAAWPQVADALGMPLGYLGVQKTSPSPT
jgi:DNA-binding transcriptional regulator YhcF (GntR family)